MSLNKKIILTAAGLICICVLFLASVIVSGLYIPVSSKNKSETVRVEIPSGTSTKKIGSILKKSGLIRSEKLFYAAARFPVLTGRNSPYALKSGVYNVENSMTLGEILHLLESGQQEYIKVVISEGLTLTKIASLLDEAGVCKQQHFIMAAKNLLLLQQYGVPAESFEGFLFPDTYFLTPDMDPAFVVKMMVNNFLEKIKVIPEMSDKSIADIFKIVVLASVVEREYRVPSEAPLIASVFTNRIKNNDGLYSCATIEYIITEIYGRPHPDVITYDDLKIDNPYNTYKWAGLTPGPISNPGLVALRAAANPPKTSYYYFTLNNAEAGSHTFSTSFSSHTQAGNQFKTKKAASSK